jgi:multiple sugar transport system substrate-binding protein
MRTNRILMLALVLVAALALVGVVAAQDPVTIILMGHGSSPAEEEALNAQVAAFMEANPNITVDVQLVPDYDTVLQTAFASGDYPNVFYVGQSNFRNFVESGVIANGAGSIESPEGFYPALTSIYTYDGDLYCPPKDFSNLALEYNTDLFDAAGVEYPNADWTWDDLQAAAQALADSGTLPEGTVPFAMNPDIDRVFAFYSQAGGQFYDDEGNFVFGQGDNFDAAVAALDFTGGLAQAGLTASSSDLGAGWTGEAFGQAKAAMTMEGNWIVGYLNDTFPELNWGTTTLPAGPGGDATLTFSEAYCVGADNDHPDESWALVNFLTNEAGAAFIAENGFGPMPSRTAASEAWLAAVGDVGQAFVDGSDVAVAPVTPAGFGEFRDALGNALGEVFRGNIDSADAVDQAVAVAEELANE